MKALSFVILLINLTACTPKIQLETPSEGITINMNVVVDHRIDVKMDERSRAVIQTKENKSKQ
ncbi:YnbE family lipoprotein [Mannheimia sp. AT1]|uniref:YnbE family lipoprotein n=1 Tax=Mannheimia cairinae TaxID=3025936 RepID=A0ABT5MQX4_9PAST|nr:YnbE family lipoprotein [Mannheimia cairinae]MDD0823976.1 YnbE family lipoprotein [Mannheimia cairinae]MDD0825292.1 YnbE family lipoprotein [Mannheimia cairinae]